MTLSNGILKIYERTSAEQPPEVTEERQLASDEGRDAALERYFGIRL